jgi:hypothetical protein
LFIKAAYVALLTRFTAFLGGLLVHFRCRNDGNDPKSREKAGKVISQPFNGRSAPGYDDEAMVDRRAIDDS